LARPVRMGAPPLLCIFPFPSPYLYFTPPLLERFFHGLKPAKSPSSFARFRPGPSPSSPTFSGFPDLQIRMLLKTRHHWDPKVCDLVPIFPSLAVDPFLVEGSVYGFPPPQGLVLPSHGAESSYPRPPPASTLP